MPNQYTKTVLLGQFDASDKNRVSCKSVLIGQLCSKQKIRLTLQSVLLGHFSITSGADDA